ncbi:MAG: hypothetical protein IJT68_08575 [Lentisphaeria bacterium]|nr:hypothetical protein [Lentisphaeria bacterium]
MPEQNTTPISEETAKEAWTKLFFISDILRNTSYSVIELEHINFAQHPIIQFFFECPDAAPAMKELIAVSGLSSGALSQAVDGLINAGYLARSQSGMDSRLKPVQATEKLKNLRVKPFRHFEKMLDAFRQASGADPKEMRTAGEVFVRLAESRTGGELAEMKRPSDMETPGAVSCVSRKLNKLPVWMLILHFTTNMRMPTLMYYYGRRGRISLGKLGILNYLFSLSYRKKALPTIKELAARFQCKPGLVLQTVNSLRRDGLLELTSSQTDRGSQVKLTRKGHLVQRQSSESYTLFMQRFLGRLEPEKAGVFMRFLDLMLHFLKTDGKDFLCPGEQPDMFG